MSFRNPLSVTASRHADPLSDPPPTPAPQQLLTTCKPSSGPGGPSGLQLQDLPRGNFHAAPSPVLPKPRAGFLEAHPERPERAAQDGQARGDRGDPGSRGKHRRQHRQPLASWCPEGWQQVPSLTLYKHFSPPRARPFPAPAPQAGRGAQP